MENDEDNYADIKELLCLGYTATGGACNVPPVYRYTGIPVYRYTGKLNFGRSVLGRIGADFCNYRLTLRDFSVLQD